MVSQSSILLNLKARLASLQKSDRLLAQKILTEPVQVVQHSAKEFSASVGVSDATVIRFSRKLGFSGYQEFKDKLKNELLVTNEQAQEKPALSFDIHVDEPLGMTADKISAIVTQSVLDTKTALDLTQVEDIVHKIIGAKRFFIVGFGASGLSAIEAEYKFNRIGIDARGLNEKHTMFSKLQHADSQDILLAISYAGENKDILKSVEIAKENGVYILALTNALGSSLSRLSDQSLLNCSEGEMNQGDSIGTRISQMFLIDLLYTQVMKLRYDSVVSNKANIQMNIKK